MKINNSEFQRIRTFVYENYGIQLTEKKKTLVESRLSHLLEVRGFASFDTYFEFLEQDQSGTEITEFINKITTNHTYFFREEKHFDFLMHTALPEITSKENHSRDIRIWSAGCSSGEEPYSIAMTISDFLGTDHFNWDSTILATDISHKVLEHATKGLYLKESLEKIDESIVRRHFRKHDDLHFKVSDVLQNEIIFRKFNLINQFPFKKKFHIIFCRNVMIYFDKASKQELINKFYDVLLPGGYLFIGHSETIEDRSQGFLYIQPAVYKKE